MIHQIHSNHKWSECPNNKANKDKAGTATKIKSIKKGRGASKETWQLTNNYAPTIHFNSENKKSLSSSGGSVKEFFEVIANTTSKATYNHTDLSPKGLWESCM